MRFMLPGGYEEIVQCLRDGIIVLSPTHFITYCNDAAREILNAGENILEQSINDFLPEMDLSTHSLPSLFIKAHKNNAELEVSLLKKTPQYSILQLHHQHHYSVNLIEAERIIRSQYFARIGTWEWIVDTDTIYWSDAIYTMFGFDVGEVTPSYTLFCQLVHPLDRAKVRAGEERCLRTGENHDEEYRILWSDGTERWLRETGNLIHDEKGKPYKMIGVVRDITEEKQHQRHLERQALYDPLTGLWNRSAFEKQLREVLLAAQTQKKKIVVAFIDLNDFKKVNDNYGHLVGDQVLSVAANRLHHEVENVTMISRIGGDEFVVLSPFLCDTESAHAYIHSTSKHIRQAIEKSIVLDGVNHDIGVSVGAAIFPDHATSADALIHVADIAMYRAKKEGKRDVAIAQPISLSDAIS